MWGDIAKKEWEREAINYFNGIRQERNWNVGLLPTLPALEACRDGGRREREVQGRKELDPRWISGSEIQHWTCIQGRLLRARRVWTATMCKFPLQGHTEEGNWREWSDLLRRLGSLSSWTKIILCYKISLNYTLILKNKCIYVCKCVYRLKMCACGFKYMYVFLNYDPNTNITCLYNSQTSRTCVGLPFAFVFL